MIRAILAVIVGYIVWTVIWLAGGLALMPVFSDQPNEAGVYDSAPYLGISLVLSVICSFAGGLACVKIARSSGWTPAIVLAVLLLVTGLGVQIKPWGLMPVWYHLPFLILLVPVTLAGAAIGRPKKA